MNAREMFENLGYSLICDNNNYLIKYSKEYCGHIDFCFDIETKRFYSRHSFSSSIKPTHHSITLDEFEAVKKQMEELGWVEEEKQEIKQETNFEYYKDEIIEIYSQNLAVVKGMPTLCYKTNCNDCDFKINQIGCRQKAKEWLNHPYKNPKYKFTQFEYDLINTYSHVDDRCKFNGCYQLKSLKEKGYFKNVDNDALIKDILSNCEVVG
nr:MAG: hypothetical protein [Bacteriophage sp.]